MTPERSDQVYLFTTLQISPSAAERTATVAPEGRQVPVSISAAGPQDAVWMLLVESH